MRCARLLGCVCEGEVGCEVEGLVSVSGVLVDSRISDSNFRCKSCNGNFGGGAVLVALAWGARVLAMGRENGMLEELMKRFDGGRVEIVAIAWDVGVDAKSLEMWG